MPRIAGVDIPADKKTRIALRYIYGVGPTTADRVLKDLGIDPDLKSRDLTEDELSRVATELENRYLIEGALRRKVAADIQRLKDINSYRGWRHRRGLPVRGQRTRTNARGRKGPKRTVAGKKSVKAAR